MSKHLFSLFFPAALTMFWGILILLDLGLVFLILFFVFLGITIAWASYFPKRNYKRINRWVIVGPVLILIGYLFMGTIFDFSNLTDFLIILGASSIAGAGYYKRTKHYPKLANGSRKNVVTIKMISVGLFLISIVLIATIEVLEFPFLQTEGAINITSLVAVICPISAITATVTYYRESISVFKYPDFEAFTSKIEKIGASDPGE